MNNACLEDIRHTIVAAQQAEQTTDALESRPAKRVRLAAHLSEGPSCSIQYQYDEGMGLCTDPLPISEPSAADPHTPSASMAVALLYNLGVANFRRGQELAALKLFRLARELCERLAGQSNVDEAPILHNIGCIYDRARDYNNALDAFARLEELARNERGAARDLQRASALNCIGVVMFHGGGSSEVMLEHLFGALSARKRILGADHKDVATT